MVTVQVMPVRTSCCQQGHAGIKTLLQQNPPALNWGCQLTQVVLYNGHIVVVRSRHKSQEIFLAKSKTFEIISYNVGEFYFTICYFHITILQPFAS